MIGEIIVNKHGKPFGGSFVRKIRCPAHYLLPADCKEDIWLRELDPLLKNVSDSACKTYKIKKHRIKTDAFGRQMLDGKKLHRMRKEGTLIQPFVTASYAIEKVYDPKAPMCVLFCKSRCKRGKGEIRETNIKRLSG